MSLLIQFSLILSHFHHSIKIVMAFPNKLLSLSAFLFFCPRTAWAVLQINIQSINNIFSQFKVNPYVKLRDIHADKNSCVQKVALLSRKICTITDFHHVLCNFVDAQFVRADNNFPPYRVFQFILQIFYRSFFVNEAGFRQIQFVQYFTFDFLNYEKKN